jgi:hypothetical protein
MLREAYPDWLDALVRERVNKATSRLLKKSLVSEIGV